jgi:hypothetical protein
MIDDLTHIFRSWSMLIFWFGSFSVLFYFLLAFICVVVMDISRAIRGEK